MLTEFSLLCLLAATCFSRAFPGSVKRCLCELWVKRSIYSFLEAVIDAEKEMALYPFLEPEADMAALLDRIERQLQAKP